MRTIYIGFIGKKHCDDWYKTVYRRLFVYEV